MFHVENFFRSHGITVEPYEPSQLGFCVITFQGKNAWGSMRVSLSLNEADALALLQGLGIDATSNAKA